MAEDVAVKIQDQEEARDLLRELNQELDLVDHYKFKNAKLLETLPSFKKEKADSLAEDYRALVAKLNEQARMNTREEAYLMSDFTREVQEFNDTILNFNAVLRILRKQVEAKE